MLARDSPLLLMVVRPETMETDVASKGANTKTAAHLSFAINLPGSFGTSASRDHRRT